MADLTLTINQRIKKVRKWKKLHQIDFAKKIGVGSAVTVRRYEKNQRTVPPIVLVRIYKEFGISPHWLLTGEGEMEVSEKSREALQEDPEEKRDGELLVLFRALQDAQDRIDEKGRQVESLNAELLDFKKNYQELLHEYTKVLNEKNALLEPERRLPKNGILKL